MDDDEDPNGDQDQWAMGRRFGFASYVHRSLNVSDHHGLLMPGAEHPLPSQPPSNDDCRQYDYSSTTRLLPTDYFTAFSDARFVKVHKSRTPDNDFHGVPRDPRSLRSSIKALDVVQTQSKLLHLHSGSVGGGVLRSH